MKTMASLDSQKGTIINSETEREQCSGEIKLVWHGGYPGAGEGSGGRQNEGKGARQDPTAVNQ